ncbi:MAG TPA: hypothetical protein VFG20_03825 [Planctomycetaceae bacterium]|nr:hypothetical protein [Planctomycetaceae bacterium]
MSATLDSGPDVPVVVTGPCRVCGEPLATSATACRRCQTPTTGRAEELDGTSVTDVVLATIGAILALAISIPVTVILSAPFWRRGAPNAVFQAAMLIATVNGWLIGYPVGVILWRWRDDAFDGDFSPRSSLRDYWQAQALSLLPFGMIASFVGALWFCARILSF